MSSLLGTTIGNYRLVAQLGEGGMGAVYLGEHPLIGKRVAVKVLHDTFASNPEAVARFFGEARAVNEIGHPSIVDVIDFGHTTSGPDRVVYLIMEYLEGRSLARVLREEGPLAPERALVIAGEIADALAASHERGIVHRDLKPDNIFLCPRASGEAVKVLDFGIAKLGTSAAGSARTRIGVVMGTPAYMSPEQCEGAGNVDARSDVYALGVVLFEMLTGRAPFQGGFGELLVAHVTQAPPRPSELVPGIPPALDAVVARALEKSREQRFAGMRELAAALRDPLAFAAGAPLADSPAWAMVPVVRGEPRSTGRHPTTLGGSAGQRAPSVPPMAASEKRRRAGLAVAFVCGALAVAIGFLVAWRAAQGGGARPGVEPPLVAPDATPVMVAPDAGLRQRVPERVDQTVRVTITTRARGAEVWVDGVRRGAAGQPVLLPSGDAPVRIVVKARGYRDWTRDVTPRADVEIDAVLVRRTNTTPPVEVPTCPPGDPDCILPPR